MKWFGVLIIVVAIALAVVLIRRTRAVSSRSSLTESEVTELVAQGLREQYETLTVKVVGDLRLEVQGEIWEKGGTMQLAKLWQTCQSPDADCREEIATYVGNYAEVFRSFREPPSPTEVVAGLRATEFVNALAKEDLHRQFAGDLHEVLLVRRPSHNRVLKLDDLKHLGVSTDEAFALGRRNLAELAKGGEPTADPEVPGLLTVSTDDGLAASWLLLDGRWRELAARSQGHLFAVAPSRDILMLTTKSDPDWLAAFKRDASEAMAAVINPLSDTVLTWTPQGWK